MSPATAFALLNAAVMPFWAVWIAAPRSRAARVLAGHAGILLLLCAVYAALLPMVLAAEGPAELGFDGLRQQLSTPTGFLLGWTHYLVLDLFAGAWIVREARRLRVGARPYLVFALLVCPVGLGAFLVRRTLRLRSFAQLGEADLV